MTSFRQGLLLPCVGNHNNSCLSSVLHRLSAGAVVRGSNSLGNRFVGCMVSKY